MTATVLQEAQNSSNVSGTSISVTLPNAVTAGSTLHVAAGPGANVTVTFTDGVNTYTALDSLFDASAVNTLAHAYAANVAAGTTTVKATFSASTPFPAIVVREIGGVTTTPIDGHNLVKIVAVTGSVSATNTSQPALVSGIAFNTTADNKPTAANGTQGIQGWSFSGTLQDTLCTSSFRVTSTGTQTPSFTTGASEEYLIAVAIFNEAASGVHNVSIAESASGADALHSAHSGQVQINESGTATDTLIALASHLDAIAEAGSAAYVVSAARSAVSALVGAANAVDALSALLTHNPAVVETGAAADTLSSVATLLVSVVEAGAAADQPSATVGHSMARSLAETGAAQDSASAVTQVRSLSVAEAGTATGALLTSLTIALQYLDTGNAQDALTSTAHLATALAEAAQAMDALTSFRTLAESLAAAAAAIDLITAFVGAGRFGPSFLTMRRLTLSTLTMVADMTPIPGQLVIEEGAACQSVVSFIGSDGNPFTPVSAQYRVDEVSTGTSIVPWTNLAVTGTQALITIAATLNVMTNATRMHEVRQVSVQLTDSAGNVDVLPQAFYIIRRLVRGQP